MRTQDLPEPYRTPLADIANHWTILAGHLNVWAGRDDTQPQPDIRESATAAIVEINRALAALNDLRLQLAAEVRASDEAAMDRTEELLRRLNGENTEAGK